MVHLYLQIPFLFNKVYLIMISPSYHLRIHISYVLRSTDFIYYFSPLSSRQHMYMRLIISLYHFLAHWCQHIMYHVLCSSEHIVRHIIIIYTQFSRQVWVCLPYLIKIFYSSIKGDFYHTGRSHPVQFHSFLFLRWSLSLSLSLSLSSLLCLVKVDLQHISFICSAPYIITLGGNLLSPNK